MLVRRGLAAFGLAVVLAGLSGDSGRAQQPAPVAPAPAATPAAQQTRHHALSLVGKPKFGADFKHFDWVRPDAPKGGSLRLATIGGFDSLNEHTIKGSAAPGLGLIYDTLLDASPDEPSTEYGLVAAWAAHPDDFSSATFGLRPEARFHDGKPITPEDVVFSLEALKKANPFYALYYKNVVRVEKTGPHQVTFHFDVKGNRELPLIVGQIPVLPKHYWTAKGSNGEARDLSKTTSEPPLGSGPYRIKAVELNRFIVYERIADYWARELPVMRGRYNFGEIRYTTYRDQNIAFEGFKGGQIDLWTESSSKNWATGYEFAAVKAGRVRRLEIPTKTVAPMQAFIFNLRRTKFQDARLRRAFGLVFDFEWANKNLFYGQYKRVSSYFGNSELAATGLPNGLELKILEEVRKQVPPEVFTTPFANPVNSTPQDLRKHMREALDLFKQAGWTLRAERVDDPTCGTFCKLMISIGLRSAQTTQVLRNAKGEPLDVELLLVSPLMERIAQPYKANLEKLGIRVRVRIVDSAQYERRVKSFDYDMIITTFAQSHSPGNEQRQFWGSAAASREGSRNRIGIRDPAIDKLIDKVIFAKSREELVAATRALDRVLLWNFYVVPQWYSPTVRVAYWQGLGHPLKFPALNPSVIATWWQDAARGTEPGKEAPK